MKVRVMHVSARSRVASHAEWDIEKWGLPISQAYMALTLIAGSVTPGFGLWALGFQASLREHYNYRINGVYSAIYMALRTRRRYRIPGIVPWALIPVARFPLITAMELAHRVPPVGRAHERVMRWHRENWYRAQMTSRETALDASGALRR